MSALLGQQGPETTADMAQHQVRRPGLPAPEGRPAESVVPLRSSRLIRTAVLVAVLAPFLLLAAFAGFDHARLRQEARQEASRVAATLAEQALRIFDTNALTLDRADERARGMSWSEIRASAELNLFLRSLIDNARMIESVGFADPRGDLVALSRLFPAPQAAAADRDYFRVHVDRDAGIFVGEVQEGRAGGGALFRLSRRRSSPRGVFDGVVFSAIAPALMTEFYQTVAGPGDSITLARSDGAVLVRYPQVAAGLQTLPPTSGFIQAIQRRPGAGFYETQSTLDDVARVHAYRQIGSYPVYVSYGLDPAAIGARWRQNLLRLGSFAALTSLLIGAVGFAALRRERGERAALDRMKSETEARLRAETNLSRAQALQAQSAFQQSEERFKKIVDANIMPMAFGTFDGGITDANDAFLQMMGYDRDDLLEGRLRWDAITPPEYLPLDARAAAELRRFGKSKPFEKEYVRKDGTRLPILIAGALLSEPFDEQNLIATYYVDLTEQKHRARELEAEREALRESEALLKAVFDATPVGIAVAAAPGGEIIKGNAAMERIMGHSVLSTAIDEYERWVCFDARGRRITGSEYPIARALHGEERPELEIHYQRGDGVRAWLHATAAPIRGEDGQVTGAVVAVVDIDRERRHLDELRTMVDELNHRVKNTLSTVQSIARQSFRGASIPDEVRAAFEGRILALSQAHNVLTRERWTGAWLSAIVAGMAANHSAAEGRFSAEGPEVRLTSRVALALALAFHELFANALRHGALTAKSGRVALSWSLTQGAGGQPDSLSLLWRESDGPSVTAPSRRGFGARMIEMYLARELNGEARVEYAPNGYRCQLRVPLGEAARVPRGAVV